MVPYFVSFLPQVSMEENLPPYSPLDDPTVQGLLRHAVGVLLPEYLTPSRYANITRYARQWFPQLEGRFHSYGKSRQILLFRKLGVRHPESILFETPAQLLTAFLQEGSPWGYPFVLKGDKGGGGSRVFPIRKPESLPRRVTQLPGNEPALMQRWVEHGGKDLRVVVYGDHAVSYFRVGGGNFYNNVCRGGRIDHTGWPDLQEKGVRAVTAFCREARIDVAGFDLMFPDAGDPVFVEINFHFGRKGLGGSEGHRLHLRRAIEDWRRRCLRLFTEGGEGRGRVRVEATPATVSDLQS
ncbi:MAG: hypothetical protein GX443_12130 [Deltaproteobacteria bacterium]|nr:hypothetical protein [Deltaproteobacteria bacterium]